jgi:hypothetical protein
MKKLIFIFVLTVFTVQAIAGLYVESKDSRISGDDETVTSKVFIETDRMRVETNSIMGPQVFIFRGDKQVMWVVDEMRKSYTEMTRADVDKLGKQLESMRKQMEEQLKNLPPEQRKMMEQMMGGSMPDMMGGQEKPVFKLTSKNKKIAGYSCTLYEGFEGSEKVREVWTASLDQIPAAKKYLAVMNQMSEFFSALGDASDNMMFLPEEADDSDGFKGIPIRTVEFVDGTEDSFNEIIQIGERDHAASLFELPSGLQKKDMMNEMPEMRF